MPKAQAFKKLIEPAVRGTQNVLTSVDRAGTVEKGEAATLGPLHLQQAGRAGSPKLAAGLGCAAEARLLARCRALTTSRLHRPQL